MQRYLNDKLLYEVCDGRLARVQQLINQGAAPNVRDPENRAILHLTILDEREAMALWLIERGSDPNAKGKYGGTPLHAAAFKGNLISKRADIKIQDEDGTIAILSQQWEE